MNYLRYPRGLYIAFYAWAKYIQSLRLWRLKHRAWGPFVEHEVIRGIIARNMKSSEVLSRSWDPAMNVISAHQVSVEENKEHPILYISWRLNVHEVKYVAMELEYLDMIWNLNKLAHYMNDFKFRLITNHSILKWIWNVKSNINARFFKWSLQLNILKNKVMIIHHSNRLFRNMNSLSWNLVFYHITLIHIFDEWKDKLSKEYKIDSIFRRVLYQLQSLNLKYKKRKSTTTIITFVDIMNNDHLKENIE